MQEMRFNVTSVLHLICYRHRVKKGTRGGKGARALVLAHDANDARVCREAMQELQRLVLAGRRAGDGGDGQGAVLAKCELAGRRANCRPGRLRPAGAARELVRDAQHARVVPTGAGAVHFCFRAGNEHDHLAIQKACTYRFATERLCDLR